MLIQINNAVEICKITNRKLIIDCYSGSFCNDFNKYFKILNIEYYTNYDILKSENIINNIDRIINSNVNYINGEYFIDDKKVNYKKDDIILLEDQVIIMTSIDINFKNNNQIVVNKSIVDEIKKKGKIDNYIGVHYRNTDMKHDMSDFIHMINKNINLYGLNKIYLSTDDHTAKKRLESLLDSKYEIIQFTEPIDNNGKNIHYGNPNKDEVIMNSLIDIYYLVKSNIFIPSVKSSFSKKVSKIRENDNFFTEIFNIENWMLPKEAIEWIFENVTEGSTILELGSGYGTEILSKSYKMYSIEQNEDWLNKFDSNYIYAPIVDGFYSRECLKNITKEYDLLIIDGPTKLSGGRLGLIENIDLFNLDCDILIDDVHREDELKLLIEISKILKKDYIIIFCDNKKFGIIKTK
jgi:hypothetical protein